MPDLHFFTAKKLSRPNDKTAIIHLLLVVKELVRSGEVQREGGKKKGSGDAERKEPSESLC